MSGDTRTDEQPDMYGDDTEDGGVSARSAALDVLDAVLRRNRTCDEAFGGLQDFDDMSRRDRGFARLLALTVLRRLGQIDAWINELSDRPVAKIRPRPVLDILRLGAAQLLFLGTPAHAAVNTCVMLAEKRGLSQQKGFINAVMRRMSRENYPEPDKKDLGHINTPAWLWQEWVRDYDTHQAQRIASANITEAPVDITVIDDPEGWAEKLDATLMPTGSLRLKDGAIIEELPGFNDGQWWVQNASAALPVTLMGDVKDRTVVDLCAAPGGKTLQLAARGAKATAVDRSARRLQTLSQNMKRMNFDVQTEAADGTVWQPKEKVDFVLLDAPCTATGTIRHQPDVLRLKEPEDQQKLARLQGRLLDNAAEMLKPGGILLYCTCSLQKVEGEVQVDGFLHRHAEFSRLPVDPSLLQGLAGAVNKEGDVRILPFYFESQGGMDGFYIARLVKR